MRLALLALALTSGCSLYFGGDHPPPPLEDDDQPPPPTEVLPDAGVDPNPPNPPESPPVYACTASGTCTANETDSCAAPLQCAVVVSAGSCTCNSGTWSCQDACNQGLCGAAAVQTAIAGDWTGTVTPPEFAQPYQVKLHIGPAGLWSGTTIGNVQVPFYYGDNGNNLGSRIVIQAQTTVGAYASIGLFGGEVQGLFTGLTVDPHHMRFAFVDSWLSCTRTFYFDLTR
jgi:hypothetical protein